MDVVVRQVVLVEQLGQLVECFLMITLPNLRASSEVLSNMTFCLFGKHSSAKFSVTSSSL